MKYFSVMALTSCNTMIGIGRDAKQGYLWTKEKIQNAGNKNGGGGGSGNNSNSGAPVY